jgi:hypothetical protein
VELIEQVLDGKGPATELYLPRAFAIRFRASDAGR